MRKNTIIAMLLTCLPFWGMATGTLSLSMTGHDAKCNGSNSGSAAVTVTGGTGPYSYVWSPAVGTTDSVSGLAAGIYSVLVTDSAGDTVRGSITITQPPPMTVIIDSIIVPPCFRITGSAVCGCGNLLWAVVSGGTPPYSYLWTPGNSAGQDTGDSLTMACYEDFTVTVTDSNNCVSTDSIYVTVPDVNPILISAGVAQLSGTDGISIYPNPTSGVINISIDQPAGSAGMLAVYNLVGEKLLQQALGGNERSLSLDVSGIADGNYFLSITSNGSQKTVRFSVVK